MQAHDVLAGVAVLVGLLGTVVPIIPGLVLQVIAVTVWAFEESSPTGWSVLIAVVLLAASATILKYLSPGRQLKEAGVPGRVLTLALIVGMILFFPLPVVGGPLGFVATIYLFERMRVGPQQAWPSTRAAIKAVLQSIGIEMGGAFLIAVVFFTSALLI
ncbi:MAG TPA: DUF456 domain-containing protein [Acidimicrobiia bacterium]|nr:DUF456 domain-containing protein [Acidimicrobiia bacterium]